MGMTPSKGTISVQVVVGKFGHGQCLKELHAGNIVMALFFVGALKAIPVARKIVKATDGTTGDATTSAYRYED